MNKGVILESLRKSKHDLENKFGIRKMGLFGSYAKSLNNIDSDIDLVYELKIGHKMGLKEINDLELYFLKLFENKKIDLVNSKYMNPIIKYDIVNTVIYV